MIQVIGFMIAFYILTRSIGIAFPKSKYNISGVLAMLTIIVAIVGIFTLLEAGNQIDRALAPLIR
jgi:hypothetical protein